MKTTIKAIHDLAGTTVDARIEAIFDYGAMLSFSVGETCVSGYIHVSQFQTDFLPSLKGAISLGQTLRVQVLYWDGRHECWETSAVAAIQGTQALSKWPRGTRCNALVVASRDRSIAVRFPDETMGIVSKQDQGNACFALEAAGRLDPGKFIQLVVSGWDRGGAGLLCRLNVGGDHPLPIGAVVAAETFLVMESHSPKRPGCYRIYAETAQGHILRVVPKEILEPKRLFPIGSTHRFRITGQISAGTTAAEPADGWAEQVPKFGTFPAIGTECNAVIQRVWQRRVLCLVADGCLGVLDSTTVIPDTDADLQSLFARCDTLRTQIVGVESSEDGRKTAILKFIKLVSRRENFGPATVESELRDLAVERRAGTASGFTRDAKFRSLVIEAYTGRCAFCKKRWTFGDFEAVEAAHIIPRGCRGSDTLQNGVALCPFHHWAFDKGLVCVESDKTIRVSGQVFIGSEDHALLTDLHGEEILQSQTGEFQTEAFAWHRQHVFLDVAMFRRTPAEVDKEGL